MKVYRKNYKRIGLSHPSLDFPWDENLCIIIYENLQFLKLKYLHFSLPNNSLWPKKILKSLRYIWREVCRPPSPLHDFWKLLHYPNNWDWNIKYLKLEIQLYVLLHSESHILVNNLQCFSDLQMSQYRKWFDLVEGWDCNH